MVSISHEEEIGTFRGYPGFWAAGFVFIFGCLTFTKHKKAPVLKKYRYNYNLKVPGARKSAPEMIIL